MANLVLRNTLNYNISVIKITLYIALWGSLNFQNLIRIVARFLERLHDLVIVWLVVVLVIVVFIRIKVIISLRGILFSDSQLLEVTWTIIPIFILIRIAYPRIYLLCLQDSRSLRPTSTLKVIRNQWNWQRECSESIDHLLDSERIELRTSYESPLLINTRIRARFLTIRTDVLHSLGIPRLGIKLDTSPGRIRITIVEASFPGVFLGSCYELCGRGHRAIPIHVLCL